MAGSGGGSIPLIKVADADGDDLHFNPAHVAYFKAHDASHSAVTFVDGEKIVLRIHPDDLAARMARL